MKAWIRCCRCPVLYAYGQAAEQCYAERYDKRMLC